MTSRGDSGGQTVPLRAGGVDLARLAESIQQDRTRSQRVDDSKRFWVSQERAIDSRKREVMEVSFGSERLVNHLSFRVSRFPLTMSVEYLDANGDWQGLTYAHNRRTVKGRKKTKREPVRLTIADSVPKRINPAHAKNHHPRHFSRAHWRHESWRVIPVRTSKIRLVFTRNRLGDPPRNHHGTKIPYSVAVRDLVIGYRVNDEADIPAQIGEEPWWASSKDILGSQVMHSTYRQPADRAIDNNRKTYWRSEPQPFPFAVVNMFLDVRDAEGVAPVVNRFWVDPVTSGPMCNLYYSNTEPDGDFDGVSEPIPEQYRTETASPRQIRDVRTQRLRGLGFGPGSKVGVEASNTYLRMRYDQDWWVGVDVRTKVDTTSTGPHPIISVGTTRVEQEGASLKVVAQDGSEASIDLDPSQYMVNTHYRMVVSYHPDDPDNRRSPYLRLAYRIDGHDPSQDQIAEIAVLPLENVSSPVRVGMHPDPLNTDTPAIDLYGLVVKSEYLPRETEDWFLDEGEALVADPDNLYEDRGTTQNSRLRVHPNFVTSTNLFGLVGGSGDRFDEMEWIPVLRDYTLRRGYFHLAPTKAAFWKFEITNLLPQVYENPEPLERAVNIFPRDVVEAHQRVHGLANDPSSPSGSQTTGNMASQVAYSDQIEAIRPAPAAPDRTEALVVRDPVRAEEVAQHGWIWQYEPWHVGSSAPKFMGKQVHRYETLLVRHRAKVGYFAGIREVQPFRVDYTFDDDTPEYVEQFKDTEFIDLVLTKGVDHFEGGVRSRADSAEVVSEGFLSYRNVRGVQFAAQETDAIQVLTDPDFNASHLDYWRKYGDATLRRLGVNDLLVTRGWFFNTWGDLERIYPTYGNMDGVLYATLEGNNQASGSAEGGVLSETYTPSGAGKILGIVKMSAAGEMNGPISVELVSTYDDRVLASSGPHWLRIGETSTVRVGYVPGTITERRTYGDVEQMVSNPTTYGELNAYKYYEIETENSIFTDLYLRVRQQGGHDDSWHVHRIGLYDSPVAWYFSNDDGASWWQAIDVKNDPYAVMLFPHSLTPATDPPGTGRTLRWKARIFKENASITALNIRPLYGTRERTTPRAHGLESLGPNQSMRDEFPATHQHPMWQWRFNPIEHEYDEPEVIVPIWRNLAINPGAEWEESPPVPLNPNIRVAATETDLMPETSLSVPVTAEVGDLFIIAANGGSEVACYDSRIEGSWLDGAGRAVWWGHLDDLNPFDITASHWLSWGGASCMVYRDADVVAHTGARLVADFSPAPSVGSSPAAVVVALWSSGTVAPTWAYDDTGTYTRQITASEGKEGVSTFDWFPTEVEPNPPGSFSTNGTHGEFSLLTLKLNRSAATGGTGAPPPPGTARGWIAEGGTVEAVELGGGS